MKRQFIYLILLLSITITTQAQEKDTAGVLHSLHFSNLNEVFAYAEQNSAVIKTNNQQTLLAKFQRIESIANIINFRNDNSFTMTDNTALATQYVPSDLLGGQPGTFEPITLGQQYVSSFTVSAQIDIINPSAWSLLKKSKLNQQATDVNNLLNKKSLYESITACYFNIVSLQEQIEVTHENLAVSDSLCTIVNNKFTQNIVSKQDVNSAATNRLLLVNKLNQCTTTLKQQYSSLKVLCDIPQETDLYITSKLDHDHSFTQDLSADSQLTLKSMQLESEKMKANLNSNRMSYLPVLSAFASWSDNQNSNNHFFDSNSAISQWVRASYVGLKLSFSIPDAARIAQTRKMKSSYEISRIDLAHTQIQNEQENSKLRIDYHLAYEQYANKKQIYALLEENYKLDKNRYDEGVISLEDLLKSFDKMLTARFDVITSLSNLFYNESKTELNNKIQ